MAFTLPPRGPRRSGFPHTRRVWAERVSSGPCALVPEIGNYSGVSFVLHYENSERALRAGVSGGGRMAVQPWGQQGSGYGKPPSQVPPQPYSQPYPPTYAQPPAQSYPQPWQPAPIPQSAMRAAHTDRDRTVDVLKAAYAEGRLSAEEYSQRFDAAHRAQTYGELSQIVADLPSGPMVLPMGGAVPVVPPTFLPPPMMVPMQRPTNGLAMASLVLGLLCIPTGGTLAVPAVVCGHLAKSQLKTGQEEGDGLATAGLVIGWLSIAGWAAFLLLVVAAVGGSG